MRLLRLRIHVPVVALLAICSAARAVEPGPGPEQAIHTASQDGTLLYLVFYRETDATTNTLLETVKTASNGQVGTSWATVHVTDPAERPGPTGRE